MSTKTWIKNLDCGFCPSTETTLTTLTTPLSSDQQNWIKKINGDKKFQMKWHTSNISKLASKWHEMRFKCAFDHSNEISVNTISSASSASSASSESSLCGGATSISDGIFWNQNQNSWFWTCRPASFSCSRDVERRGGGCWQCSGFFDTKNVFWVVIIIYIVHWTLY